MADLPPNGPREGANIDDINSLGPKLLTEAELRADVAELAAWSEQQKRLREDEDALLEDLKDDPDLSEKFEALLLMDRMKRRVIRDGPQPGNYKYSAATGRFVEAEPKHRDHRLGIADRQNPGQFLPPKFDPHNPDTYPVSDLRSTINRSEEEAAPSRLPEKMETAPEESSGPSQMLKRTARINWTNLSMTMTPTTRTPMRTLRRMTPTLTMILDTTMRSLAASVSGQEGRQSRRRRRRAKVVKDMLEPPHPPTLEPASRQSRRWSPAFTSSRETALRRIVCSSLSATTSTTRVN
ncbi:hypothetical protein BJ546DRAFT_1004207 [Cryomyces antarcticus]